MLVGYAARDSIAILTCSFLGLQRFAFVCVEEAKGCILGLAILCLGALP